MGLDPKIIGSRIRQKRQQLNMSQKELADKIDVSASAVNQYEKGDKVPSSDKIIKLAQALGTSSDFILGVNDTDDIFIDEAITQAFKAFKELDQSDRNNIIANINFLRSVSKKRS